MKIDSQVWKITYSKPVEGIGAIMVEVVEYVKTNKDAQRHWDELRNNPEITDIRVQAIVVYTYED